MAMRMMIAVMVVIGLSGCHKIGEQVQVYRAKSDIASAMKDPASADFRKVKHAKYGSSRVVCGEVNGRNGFGAMGGFRSFMYVQPLMRFDDGSGREVANCCAALMDSGKVEGVRSTSDVAECSGVDPAMPLP